MLSILSYTCREYQLFISTLWVYGLALLYMGMCQQVNESMQQGRYRSSAKAQSVLMLYASVGL